MQKIFKHISEWVTDRVEALKIMVYILEHELYTKELYNFDTFLSRVLQSRTD